MNWLHSTCSAITLVCLFCLATEAFAAATDGSRTTTVGMPARIADLILPGSPLEVAPIERRAPVVVRILQTIGHGPDQHRYELEYYCLDPGEYNLADYLRRVDGSPTDLPEIMVTAKSQLGEGQVVPNALAARPTPRVGGYTTWLIVGGIVWLVGLFAILFVGRGKAARVAAEARKISLADRLKPLVEQATRGELPREKHAELERMLLTYWRGKLDLNAADASEAIIAMKNHETAGELLRQLEGWLHMPADRRPEVNVAELLEPYRDVRDEHLNTEAETAQ